MGALVADVLRFPTDSHFASLFAAVPLAQTILAQEMKTKIHMACAGNVIPEIARAMNFLSQGMVILFNELVARAVSFEMPAGADDGDCCCRCFRVREFGWAV